MATTTNDIPGVLLLTKSSPGEPVEITKTSEVSLSHTETRPDRVRTRKPTGWLYPKPYTLSVHTRRRPVGTVRTRTTEGTNPNAHTLYSWTGDLSGLVDAGATVAILSPSSTERRASQLKALTKLKDQRINLGVAFAEANRTASFVGTVATRLAKAAMQGKKGNFKGALNQLGVSNWKSYPKGWLGYQYAAKPLLNDVYGAIQAMKSHSKFSDWVVTVKGVTIHRERTESLLQTQENHPGTRCVVTDTHFRGYFTRLDYVPTNDLLVSVSSLGVTNPLEVVWELVPFSFVADWFIPIGEWFSSFDAALGFTFLSGSTTERIEATRIWTSSPGPPQRTYPYGRDEGSKFTGKARRLSLIRQVHSSSPVIPLPRVKSPLSLVHMANGLSLLASVFGSRR